MKNELADECAYTREASFLQRFRAFLENDPRFHVPWVWEGSTDQVLVMERVAGTSVGGNVIEGLSQNERDVVCYSFRWTLSGCGALLTAIFGDRSRSGS